MLQGLDLRVSSGTSIAITGSSGSGKTTLLNIIAGLDSPDAGEVYVSGQLLAELNSSEMCKFRNRNIGFVFQFHNLLSEFTAVENIAMPLMIAGSPRRLAVDQALHLMDKVGLGKKQADYRLVVWGRVSKNRGSASYCYESNLSIGR